MKKRPIVITKNNMITLPKWLREKLDLQPGDCLDYETMANGSIILARKECCSQQVCHASCRVISYHKIRE